MLVFTPYDFTPWHNMAKQFVHFGGFHSIPNKSLRKKLELRCDFLHHNAVLYLYAYAIYKEHITVKCTYVKKNPCQVKCLWIALIQSD